MLSRALGPSQPPEISSITFSLLDFSSKLCLQCSGINQLCHALSTWCNAYGSSEDGIFPGFVSFCNFKTKAPKKLIWNIHSLNSVTTLRHIVNTNGINQWAKYLVAGFTCNSLHAEYGRLASISYPYDGAWKACFVAFSSCRTTLNYITFQPPPFPVMSYWSLWQSHTKYRSGKDNFSSSILYNNKTHSKWPGYCTEKSL